LVSISSHVSELSYCELSVVSFDASSSEDAEIRGRALLFFTKLRFRNKLKLKIQ
jgi:hypothetical protein